MCTHVTLAHATLTLIRVTLTLLWKPRHLDVYIHNLPTGPCMIGHMDSPNLRHSLLFWLQVLAWLASLCLSEHFLAEVHFSGSNAEDDDEDGPSLKRRPYGRSWKIQQVGEIYETPIRSWRYRHIIDLPYRASMSYVSRYMIISPLNSISHLIS